MVAPFLTLYLAIGVGQVVAAADGADTAWLKAIPADAEAAIRVRRLDLVRADLAKMLQAMSPTVAEITKDPIETLSAQFEGQFGKVAAENPIILVTRTSAPGTQALGMIIGTAEPEAIKKAIADGKPIKPGARPGDPDSITWPDGKPMYLVSGAGYAAFSTDSTLAGSLAKPLDNLKWTETLVNSFSRGDIGILLNVPVIEKNHGDQIEQFKTQLIAGMDQAPNGGGETIKETIKGFVNTGFNAIKTADLVAFYVDFEPYGLAIAGKANVLPGTTAAANLEKATPIASTLPELLPGDATFFVDLAANPAMTTSLMKMGLSMGMGKAVAESDSMKKALALYQEAGIGEMATASFGTSSTIGLYLANDPGKAVEASLTAMKALGETKEGADALYKSVTIKPEVQTFQGFQLHEVEIVLDLEKIAKLQPENPNAVETFRKMYGGDSIHSWVGTDGKRFLTATATNWDAARAEIEPIVTGVGALGKLPNYGTLREQLPLKTNFLMIGSAQGLVRQIARQMSAAIPGGADIKPGAMPAEIALFGAAIVASPGGYIFEFRLPSANGQVFEKGFGPVIQGLQGKVGM